MNKLPTKNPFPGTFIVFEGIDGCGKSTQAEILNEYLAKTFKTLLTAEPTKEGRWGQEARKIIESKKKISGKNLQELFILDRLDHLENTVIPTLRDGIIVICDRYYFSTLTYGASDELPESWIMEKHKETLGDKFIEPDITFIIKISPKTAFERKQKEKTNKKLDRFETLEYMKNIAENYEKFSGQKNVFMINGEDTPENVQQEIIKILECA